MSVLNDLVFQMAQEPGADAEQAEGGCHGMKKPLAVLWIAEQILTGCITMLYT
jgi:hypothetical protein